MSTGKLAPRVLGQFLCVLALTSSALAWSPGTGSPTAVDGFAVDGSNRRDVLAYYQTVYRASEGYENRIAWTGNVSVGTPGTTSAVFKDDVRRRINFYRALVELPADITFSATKSAKAQEASLMFSANNDLSHAPTPAWLHYTANANEAAGSSNLTLGGYGPGAVDALMEDPGANNTPVGHRRWLLFSRAHEMGTGDVPFNTPYNAASTIWVIGDEKPIPTPQFVAWPNEGFSPVGLTPVRWSLSYPEANFSAASVTMSQGGNNVPLVVVSNSAAGFGDNSIVWEPAGLPANLAADQTYSVTVSGISGAGIPTSHSYDVTLFDPNVLGEDVVVSGTMTPPVSETAYTFNAIEQADDYEVRVTAYSTAAWTEGAEDAPAPQIIDQTTGGWTLRQASVKRTGAKAFHLAFPTILGNTQIIEVAREIVPTAASQLVFYDLFRFATAESRLSAEVSDDSGLTWTEVWGRDGNGSGSSANFDPAFNPRSISLAAYADISIRVRFRYHFTSSAFVGTSVNYGVFLDDISVTSAGELTQPTVTSLGAGATGFTLNATTAGGALSAGTEYYLQVRPLVGTKWFPYGPALEVIARSLTGFESFVDVQYPALSGDPEDDYDGDLLADVVEYAFGTDPTMVTSPASVPPVVSGVDTIGFAYAEPAGVTDVIYGAQWSIDLKDWTDMTDTGTDGNLLFSVSTINQPKIFLRHKISLSP